ncbi:hypothetical protein [Mycobacterium xenopi]|uniref:hypothetical protein n=1 Tax=Mycobacterium xenopi TaxID=1789 RepID=UPI000A1685DC|nr:hypothetical protein [Mycobacterium xenopi]ORX14132.1 hypothetical protein AWC32_14205 [Mycobacterium xenopi]SPX94865.1 Uncharacterised protein [Mycobacterium xenopi]
MFVAKWYTRASRVRIVIAKFDGRWKLPGGPYPIPELVALVGGILLTLFLLPRFGQPLLTAAVGLGMTTVAVGAMRRMPYSPVKFSTRIHRTIRLYTSPVSSSCGDELRGLDTVSTVRPNVTILDSAAPAPAASRARHARAVPAAPAATAGSEWDELFAHPPSAAAELFI